MNQHQTMVNDTPITFIGRNDRMNSEFVPGQHFLYRTGVNSSCPVRAVYTRDFVENRIKEIDKVIRETALVNSTFASAILQLTQMSSNAESLTEHITIYNSLQECLSTSIISLEQIQDTLTVSGENNFIICYLR